MARKPNPLLPYILGPHRSGGYVYATVREPFKGSSGKTEYKHVVWGNLVDSNVFIPNKEFILLPAEERDKYIFPEDWNLDEYAKIMGTDLIEDNPERICTEDNFYLYGDIWLMNNIARHLDIVKDLGKVFENDTRAVQDILTIAYHMYLGRGTLNQLSHWQRIEKLPTPATRELSSPYITLFSQSIKECHRSAFIRLRLTRVGEDDLLCIDTTTRSAYGSKKNLCDIRFGKNKDDKHLPCTIEAVLYDVTQHEPVYYRSFPGNTPDSRVICLITEEIRSYGVNNRIVVVSDRGCVSTRNIEYYIEHMIPFISAYKTSNALVKNHIRDYGNFDGAPSQMSVDPDERMYYAGYSENYKVRTEAGEIIEADNFKVHIYYNPKFRGMDKLEIDIEREKEKRELERLIVLQDTIDLSRSSLSHYKYFELDIGENGCLKSFTPKETEYNDDVMLSGFFSLVSHMIDRETMDVLSDYALRGEQELDFEIIKDEEECDKQGNWSEDGKFGRDFIHFVGSILISNARFTWRNNQTLFKKFDSTRELFTEMRPIKYMEHKGQKPVITPFIGDQEVIAKEFGFSIPKNCSKKYTSKKVK